MWMGMGMGAGSERGNMCSIDYEKRALDSSFTPFNSDGRYC